jgi:hypothetical protein
VRRLLVVVGLVAVAIGASACTGTTTAPTTTTAPLPPTTTSKAPHAATTTPPATTAAARSATLEMRTALRHGDARPSLHYVSTSLGDGLTTTITGDVNQTSGAQTVALSYKGDTVSMEIELVGHEAYFRGSAAAIADIIGLSAAQSVAAAGQWVSVVPSDTKYYSSTAAALTVTSVMSQLVVSPPITGARSVAVRGRGLVAISGAWTGNGLKASDHATAVLEVSSGRASLPVLFSGVEPKSAKTGLYTASFAVGKWGEPVHVVPPTASVPLSTVLKSPTTTTRPVVV